MSAQYQDIDATSPFEPELPPNMAGEMEYEEWADALERSQAKVQFEVDRYLNEKGLTTIPTNQLN